MSAASPLFAFMANLKSNINRVIMSLTPLFCWLLSFLLGFRSGMRSSNIMSNAGYSDVLWAGFTLFATVGAIIVLVPRIFHRGIHQIWLEKSVTLIDKMRYLLGIVGVGTVSGAAFQAFVLLANSVLHFWPIK